MRDFSPKDYLAWRYAAWRLDLAEIMGDEQRRTYESPDPFYEPDQQAWDNAVRCVEDGRG